MAEFFNLAFWQQMFSTFLGTGVGAYLGFKYGLRLYRHQMNDQERRQDGDRQLRRKQLLGVLKRCTTTNRHVLEIVGQPMPDEVPTMSLDYATLDWILLQESTSPLENLNLSERISDLRYGLLIVNRQIEMLQTAVILAGTVTVKDVIMTTSEHQRNGLKAAIRTNASLAIPLCDRVLGLIGQIS
jgi:hypothetical protein